MAWSSWSAVYVRLERSPMDRFKNKSRLLKVFSSDGVRVYDALDGSKTARQLQSELGLGPEAFALIMDFMVSGEMAQDAAAQSAAGALSGAPAAPASSSPESGDVPPRAPPADPEGVPPSGQPRAPPPSPPRMPPRAPPPAPRAPPSPPPSEEEAVPIEPRPPASPAPSGAPSARRPSPPPYGAGAPASRPDDYPSISARSRLPPGAGAPPAGAGGPPSGSPPSGPTAPSASSAGGSLSPLERIIFDKYGEVGVKVYALIDGERTAEDILNETGVSETKLVEILEFMNEQGIIKLERPAKPGGAPPSAPPPPKDAFKAGMGGSPSGAAGARGPGSGPGPGSAGSSLPPSASGRSSDDGVGFKPMVGSQTEAEGSETLSPDAVPVDVPILASPMNLVQKARLFGILSAKFGRVGNDLIKHVDGVKDFVEIASETGLTLKDLDIILGELGKADLVRFKQLTRNEVRHRYGDDGLAVYKRWGRDGLVIFNLVGKVASLKDLVARSGLEVEKAVDIVIFVHRVLGLDLPLDRDMIYRYIKKK